MQRIIFLTGYHDVGWGIREPGVDFFVWQAFQKARQFYDPKKVFFIHIKWFTLSLELLKFSENVTIDLVFEPQ